MGRASRTTTSRCGARPSLLPFPPSLSLLLSLRCLCSPSHHAHPPARPSARAAPTVPDPVQRAGLLPRRRIWHPHREPRVRRACQDGALVRRRVVPRHGAPHVGASFSPLPPSLPPSLAPSQLLAQPDPHNRADSARSRAHTHTHTNSARSRPTWSSPPCSRCASSSGSTPTTARSSTRSGPCCARRATTRPCGALRCGACAVSLSLSPRLAPRLRLRGARRADAADVRLMSLRRWLEKACEPLRAV